jgi:hypothetical protein
VSAEAASRQKHPVGRAAVDVAPEPRDVNLLGASAVVAGAESPAYSIEQSRLGGPARTVLADGGRRATPAAVGEGYIHRKRMPVNADHALRGPLPAVV